MKLVHLSLVHYTSDFPWVILPQEGNWANTRCHTKTMSLTSCFVCCLLVLVNGFRTALLDFLKFCGPL